MIQYKHIPTGKIFTKAQNFVADKNRYYQEPYQGLPYMDTFVPAFVVETGSDWEKVEEILLTTEDGVGIKKGQLVFSVRTQYNNWQTTETLITKKNQVTSDFGWKQFSSKQKRTEYILWNEPRFSLKEIWKQLIYMQGENTANTIIKYLIDQEKLK